MREGIQEGTYPAAYPVSARSPVTEREVGVVPMDADPKQMGAVKTKVSPMAVRGRMRAE